MIEDEVMQQVRAAKEAFAASHGYDLRRMIDALRKMDEESGSRRSDSSRRNRKSKFRWHLFGL